MPKCIELLPCDWLISYLCYQAIEPVYLIKWPVSVYIWVLLNVMQKNSDWSEFTCAVFWWTREQTLVFVLVYLQQGVVRKRESVCVHYPYWPRWLIPASNHNGRLIKLWPVQVSLSTIKRVFVAKCTSQLFNSHCCLQSQGSFPLSPLLIDSLPPAQTPLAVNELLS